MSGTGLQLPDVIAKPLGIGTYTTKDGQVITYNDLPPEVQAEVDRMAPMRDTYDNLKGYGVKKTWEGNDTEQELARRQALINELYEPSTRENAMAGITGRRIVEELGQRMSARDAGRR
jgi:hypothetical protein